MHVTHKRILEGSSRGHTSELTQSSSWIEGGCVYITSHEIVRRLHGLGPIHQSVVFTKTPQVRQRAKGSALEVYNAYRAHIVSSLT